MTLFFTIDKTLCNSEPCHDSLLLPSNWQILVKRTLNPNDAEIKYMYTLASPKVLTAGDYTIQFQIKSKGIIKAFKDITINVEQVRKIEIFTLEYPEYAKEGDTIGVQYLLQNLGNTTEKVKLETERGTIESVKDSVMIEPNSSLNLTVKQVIPITETSNSWQTSSDLKAYLNDASLPPAYQVVSIPIYSHKVKNNNTHLRFPMEVGGGYLFYKLGNTTWSTYQYYANGKGFLDFKNKHELELTVRGPNEFSFPTLGNYDEYALKYNYNNKSTLQLGDYLLKVNNLMEFGRFGRGFKYEQAFKKTDFNVFYQKARLFPNQKDALGGTFGLKLNDKTSISLNYIHKNVIYNNRSFGTDIIGSSFLIRKNNLIVETELASGSALGKADIGFYNKLAYSWKRLNISNDLIYAGKNFYGFYNNSYLIVNTINYNITPQINAGITSNISSVNPSLDANVYYASPFNNSHMVFASFQPNAKNLFFLNFTRQERKDRQLVPKFHFKEDFGNFSYSFNSDRWNLFLQSRYGFALNLLVSDSLSRQQSFANMVQPTVRVLPWLWLGGYFEHQHTTKYSLQNTPENLLYYGGSIRMHYKKNLHLNLMYRNNYAPDELFEKRSFIDASLVFDTKYQTLSITGGQAYFPNINQSNQNTLFFSIKNVWKLNIPLARNKNLGHLRGRLTSEGFNIDKSGYIVQLGQQKCITDTAGFFHFSNLAPDRYLMTLIKSNHTEGGVVPTVKVPMEVQIKADSTPFIQLPLTKTGNIIGKILIKNNAKTPAYSAKNIPTILVKIFNEKEQIITQVNTRGEFSFKEMKLGTWKILAFIPSKEETYSILNAEQTVEVQPNTEKEIIFTAQPLERKIYISPQSYQLNIKK